MEGAVAVRLAWLIVPFCCYVSASGQQTSKPNQLTGNAEGYALPVENVDLGLEGKRIIGVPNTNSMTYPVHGASDGTIFVEMYDDSKPQASPFTVGDLYAISEDAKVTRIQRKSPEDVEQVLFLDVYASDSVVASVASASPRKKSPDERPSREIDYFICLSKRDGTFEKLIPLKGLRFQPFKIAVLESGRFFVAGIDGLNKTPVLAMLDSDGQYLRPVDLDNRPFDNSKSLHAIYPHLDTGAEVGEAAISNSGFVPFGERILFYIPGTKLPVRILGEGGEENSIPVHLPSDYLLETILPCAKNDTWVIRAQAVQQFAQMQSDGVISNPQQVLFEVNPSDGQALRRLDISGGIYPGQVDSAANKKLICLRQTADMRKSPATWFAVEQGR
jgi:hypothetical protein